MEDSYAAATTATSYATCGTCNGGSWVENMCGAYVPCPVCHPIASESFPFENNAY
jgi:hypothetical protein